MQHLLFRLLESGAFDQHVDHLRHVYEQKLQVTLEALAESFGTDGHDTSSVHWTHPTGGMYVWLRYPANVDTSPNGKLMKAALDEGILYVPGSFCYLPEGSENVPSNEMRLCFGVASLDDLREGVSRLARATAKVYPELVAETTAV